MYYIVDTAHLWGQRYLAEMQSAAGLWAGPTSSRMLETALVVLALRAVTREHPLLQAGRIWLQDHHPQAEPAPVMLLETLYQRAALNEQPSLALQDRAFYDDPGLLRPTLLLLVLGQALGCAVHSPLSLRAIVAELRAITAQRERLDLPPAVLCEYLAVYVLAATLLHGAASVAEEAQALAALQAPDGGFFNQSATTAAAMLALRYAAPDRSNLNAALVALEGMQNQDGGWGPRTLSLLDTGRCLTVARDAPTATTERALAWIEANQQEDGSWAEGGVPATWSTAVVLRGLSPFREQPTVAAMAQRAATWLAQARQENGLWDVGGIEPSPERIAEIVQALRFWPPAGRTTLAKAEQWLLRAQGHTGLWSAPWTINDLVTTATVVAALGPASIAVQRAARLVCEQQDSGGGWGRLPDLAPSPLSTAAALEILLVAESHDARAIRRGLDWLVTQQQGGGTWRGSRELCDPAPLRYNNRAFVHAACMRAVILGRFWVQTVDTLA